MFPYAWKENAVIFFTSSILILILAQSITDFVAPKRRIILLAWLRCSDMEMRRGGRLLIILSSMAVVVMVTESWACNLQKLKFIQGDVESYYNGSNHINIEDGLIACFPRGTPEPPSGPSQGRNYRSSPGSGGGPSPVNQIDAPGINAYPGLWNCSRIDQSQQQGDDWGRGCTFQSRASDAGRTVAYQRDQGGNEYKTGQCLI